MNRNDPQTHLRTWAANHKVGDPVLGPCPLGVASTNPRPNNGCAAAGLLSFLLPYAHAYGPWMAVAPPHRYADPGAIVQRFAHASHNHRPVRYLAISGLTSRGFVWWMDDNSGLLARVLEDGTALVHPAILRMNAPPATCSIRFSPDPLPPALILRHPTAGTLRKTNTVLDSDLSGAMDHTTTGWNALLRTGVDALDGVFDTEDAVLLPPHLASDSCWAPSGPPIGNPETVAATQHGLNEVAAWLAVVFHRHAVHPPNQIDIQRDWFYRSNTATLAWDGARAGHKRIPAQIWERILPAPLYATVAPILHSDIGIDYRRPKGLQRWQGVDGHALSTTRTTPTQHAVLNALATYGDATPAHLEQMQRILPGVWT